MKKRTIEDNEHSENSDAAHAADVAITGSHQNHGLITLALIPGKAAKEVGEARVKAQSGLIGYGSDELFEASALETVGARLMHLLEQFSGALLGGLAVSTQIGNILICIFMILWGPAFVIGFIDR